MEINHDTIWENILALKKEVSSLINLTNELFVFIVDGKLLLGEGAQSNKNKIISLKITSKVNSRFLSDVISWDFSDKINEVAFGHFIKLYLPYVFLPIASKQLNRAITISHFAQTLDGKIATNSGSSKWIGNSENLIHAHRMRALCEGIMVGRQTMLSDKPKLNVRHCIGENPKKIILGRNNCQEEISEIIGEDFIEISTQKTGASSKRSISMSSFNGTEILEKLFKKGIYSIYLEGGSKTTSAFLNCSGLDQIQLHVSPIILGSGVSSFSLPEVTDISEGIHFSKFMFVPVGNTVMFIGNQTSN